MKIILSRKGFDDRAGGCASPILPNGTMLSMPIPTEERCEDRFDDLYAPDGLSYAEVWSKLLGGKRVTTENCHLDPDIRDGMRKITPEGWVAAFGQAGSAQSVLRNRNVGIGDIFLFFGWFHGVDRNYHFIKKDPDWYRCSDLQAVYGYMQIGEIITGRDIDKYYWHPHAKGEGRSANNTLYLPAKTCSLTGGPGYGVLGFDKKRVLTTMGKTRAKWRYRDCLDPRYTKRKNCTEEADCLFYSGQWQEMVIDSENNPTLLPWVRDILMQDDPISYNRPNEGGIMITDVDIALEGGTVASYRLNNVEGNIPFSVFTEYWPYANEEDAEACGLRWDDHQIAGYMTTASGQGGIAFIWDAKKRTLTHISNGEYTISVFCADGYLYTLCEILCYGIPSETRLYRSPIGVMDTDDAEEVSTDIPVDLLRLKDCSAEIESIGGGEIVLDVGGEYRQYHIY